jgi:hypothetical protein
LQIARGSASANEFQELQIKQILGETLNDDGTPNFFTVEMSDRKIAVISKNNHHKSENPAGDVDFLEREEERAGI